MSISFPLSLPSVSGFAELEITPNAIAGVSGSPFSGSQQVYDWQAAFWRANARLPEDMSRADAEDWIGFLVSLNGHEGSLLAGDPLGASPRGTWAGTPLVKAAHSALVKVVAMDGFTAAATGKRGDWIQFGTGSASRLHKVTKDFTADGSGEASVDIWPGLRASLADNATFVTSGAVGLWKLAVPGVPWTVHDVRIGGISIPLVEDLRGL